MEKSEEDVFLITKDKGLINLMWRLNHYLHVESSQRAYNSSFAPAGYRMQTLDLNDGEIQDVPTSYTTDGRKTSRV